MTDKASVTKAGGSGLLTAGIVIALLIGAAGYMTLRDDGLLDENEITALVTPSGTAEKGARRVDETDAPDRVAGSENDLRAEEDGKTAEDKAVGHAAATSATEIEKDTRAPTIDEVRVDTGGTLVVAGRAEPGSSVDIVVDGAVVSSAEADAGGAFAAIGSLSAKEAAQSLRLRSGDGETVVESAEEIILAPIRNRATDAREETEPETSSVVASPEPAPERSRQAVETAALEPADPDLGQTPVQEDAETRASTVRQAAPENDRPKAGATVDLAAREALSGAPADAGGSSPQQEKTGVIARTEEPQPSPPVESAAKAAQGQEEQASDGQQIAVLRSDESGVSLLQNAPAPPASVILDTISYSDEGVVQLGGRAGPEAVEVRTYLNNRPVARLAVAADGTWRGDVPGVEAGIYTLRVDALSDDGTVTSRIETPFKREAPAVLAAATSGVEGPIRAVTVQAGDTLWAIARERYGEGVLYVQVFEANRDAIRDPDLIYPGQVFDLPAD